MSNTLYIVDTFSLIFQVFHAVTEMTGPQGQPTNAVFGFTRDLMNLRRDQPLTHLICAIDSSGPGARNDIYPEYKANRSEDRKSTRLNSSHVVISYAVFCLKKKNHPPPPPHTHNLG